MPKPKLRWTIQVQAQFEVEGDTLEEACDIAVSLGVEMESTEWGTLVLAGPTPVEPKEKRKTCLNS